MYVVGREQRVDAKISSMQEIGERIAKFYPWVRGQITKLSYTIPNTNPRQFVDIRNNANYIKVIAESTSRKKVEMFLIIEDIFAYNSRSYQLNTWRRRHPQKVPRGVFDKAKQVEYIGVICSHDDDDRDCLADQDARFVNSEDDGALQSD